MMQGKKRRVRSIINYVLIGLLFVLFPTSCQKEEPDIMPTSTGSAIAVDPTIAAVLAEEIATAEAKETAIPDGEPPSPATSVETLEFICEPPVDWIAYAIQPNDTLFAIANALGISIDAIKSANCKLDNTLIVGEILYLPQYPPIPQAPPPSYQQTIPTVNTIREQSTLTFSLDNAVQEFPANIKRELSAGVGGQPPTSHLPCYNAKDYPQKIHLETFNWSIRLCVVEPRSTDFLISLIWPPESRRATSIDAPLQQYNSPDYLYPHDPDYYYWATTYDFPREAPSGLYTISIINYPEKGEPPIILDTQVYLNPRFTLDEQNKTINLDHFKPNEMVLLTAFQYKSEDNFSEDDFFEDNFSEDDFFEDDFSEDDFFEDDFSSNPELVQLFVQQYQVNSQGYTTINIDPEILNIENIQFYAIGKQSDYIHHSINIGRSPFNKVPAGITIVNNNPDAICQLQITPTKMGDWTDYLNSSDIFFQERIESNEIQYISYGPSVIGDFYDIEALGCNGEVLYSKDHVIISHEQTWEIP